MPFLDRYSPTNHAIVAAMLDAANTFTIQINASGVFTLSGATGN